MCQKELQQQVEQVIETNNEKIEKLWGSANFKRNYCWNQINGAQTKTFSKIKRNPTLFYPFEKIIFFGGGGGYDMRELAEHDTRKTTR